jgi:hypothetical protein
LRFEALAFADWSSTLLNVEPGGKRKAKRRTPAAV